MTPRLLTGMRLRAIVAQRCPACFQGAMFTGVVTMNDHCAVCGHCATGPSLFMFSQPVICPGVPLAAGRGTDRSDFWRLP